MYGDMIVGDPRKIPMKNIPMMMMMMMMVMANEALWVGEWV